METATTQVILDPHDEDGNLVECVDCGAVISELVIHADVTLSEALERFDPQCDACMAQ